jgi:cysteine desulfurase
VAQALRPDTVLVSVMHANNEVGTLQPIAQIATLARARGVLVHCDGAQAVGKIATDVLALGVDLYSVAGHKLYAPKGVGALYVRRGTPLAKLTHGAGHEGGRRPGTENTLGIVGLGAAAELAMDHELVSATLRERRELLWAAILRGVPDVVLHGHPELRLPNTLSLGFPGVQAQDLLGMLADRVAASAGAACHADGVSISSTLRAMGVPEAQALGTVRFSVGHPTTPAEIEVAAGAVVAAVRQLRTH